MSQRNPMNDRYQNAEERQGKTRKSAASAKPVSKAASSVHVPGKAEEPKGLWARATKQANKNAAKKQSASKETVDRRREQALRSKYYNPDTPEYKKWRKIWWAMIVGALVATGISFLVSRDEGLARFTYAFIIVSYVLLIGAIALDFTHIRKLRTEYQNRMIAEENSKKNSAKRKEAAAEARRAAKEAEEAGEAAEEERKPFRGLFTRKRAADAVATAKDAQARAASEAPHSEAGGSKAADAS